MSYILEALRKSEQERERERGDIPDIKSVHTAHHTSTSSGARNVWWWLLAVVVIVNSAIFAVVYLGGDETVVAQAPEQTPPTVQEDGSRNASDTASSAVPKEPVKTRQQSTSAQASPVDEQSSKQSAPKVVFSKEPLQLEDSVGDQPPVTVDATDSAMAKAAAQAANEQNAEAGLISDLPDNIRKQIPSIAFGGHIYSSSRERRSVMINGNKRREGEVIGSDLVLSAITPTGAEFEYKGYRFRLNALQDWSYQ